MADNSFSLSNLFRDITGEVVTDAGQTIRNKVADALRPNPGGFKIGSMTLFSWVIIASLGTFVLVMLFKK